MKKITMFRVGISLIPILILVTLLALNISIFGSDAILGASQVALLFSAGVAIWLAMWLFKVPWQDFEESYGDQRRCDNRHCHLVPYRSDLRDLDSERHRADFHLLRSQDHQP